MSALASVTGIIAGVGFYALLLAFRLSGQGSIVFPIAALGMIVSVPLSFMVYREPITATNLLSLGLGMSPSSSRHAKTSHHHIPVIRT